MTTAQRQHLENEYRTAYRNANGGRPSLEHQFIMTASATELMRETRRLNLLAKSNNR